MNKSTTLGLGALVLGVALAAVPAFANDVGQNPLQVSLAAHHHHHYVHHTASQPPMPAQPQPCIHAQVSCM